MNVMFVRRGRCDWGCVERRCLVTDWLSVLSLRELCTGDDTDIDKSIRYRLKVVTSSV